VKTFPIIVLIVVILSAVSYRASAAEIYFREGVEVYRAGKYAESAQSFRHALAERPASGTLLNLGIVEWRRGRIGDAILSWEQASWLDPFNAAAKQNLEFARETSQLEAIDLAWYERPSTLLPANVWSWIACGSLAMAVGMVVLPGVLRARKAGWHQAVATTALCVFLLSIVPCIGAVTRSNIGVVLERNAALLLTPTKEGEVISSLPSGQPVRKLRARGNFILVRTQNGSGWIEARKIGFVCPHE
jgi:tetratricopeptide (TPR) repeat protein